MRSSILLLAASAVCSLGAILPRGAPALPDSAFPKFKPLSHEDAKAGKDIEHNSTHTQTQSFADFGATAVSASEAECSNNPNVRFEWRSYSDSDRVAFMASIKCLMNKPPSGNFAPATNRYEDFVRLHQLYMPNVHGNSKFLVWHRYYVWTFEQVLRTECGFNRAFPWWDETLDAGNFANSDMFTNNAYFGHLLPAQSNGQGWCINSGAFGGITLHIGPGGSNTAHCLTRAVDESLTSQCNSGFIQTCNSRTSYADMESCLEGGPHAYGHNGIGSVMSDVSASPSDPIFWMHHLFVDHSFRIWQNADYSRTQNINGQTSTGAALTMDEVIHMGGIRPDITVRDIMNTLGGVNIGGVPFCYRYNY